MLTCSVHNFWKFARPAPKLKRNEKRYNSIDYGDYRIPTPRCVSSRTETFEDYVYWFAKARTKAKETRRVNHDRFITVKKQKINK
jgi:hypothetical protein